MVKMSNTQNIRVIYFGHNISHNEHSLHSTEFLDSLKKINVEVLSNSPFIFLMIIGNLF